MSPQTLDRCVKKVSKQKGTKNAWAVCVASTGIKKKKGGGWRQTKKRKKK